jgi:hypothetical protein
VRFFHTGRVCALALIVCAGLARPTPAEAKRKDDRMVLSNGDQIVGEIKSVAQGELLFKPEYVLSSMSVDWRLVRELHSQDEYHVKLSTGQFATGTIERRADGSFLVNVTGGRTITTIWQDVVAMAPAESSFWAQLTGDINSGFSYTSGVNQTQFSASGALGYSTDRYTFHADGSSTFSGQSDGSSTRRNTLTVLNALILKPRVYAGILTDFLNSQQQDLDLRTTVGGAVGRWLVLTDKTEVTIFGGAVYTHERYSAPPDPTQPGSQEANNVEAVVGLGLAYFHFKTVDVQSRLAVYPSLTTVGRIRLNYAPTLNFEIVRNLYWNFTLYENYDSQPPVNAHKNDFGITNSIGWKF